MVIREEALAAVTGVMPPDIRALWAVLDHVPDPEIPVVSVVDLGIVRDLAFEGGVLVVRITPTYSGCPATEVIEQDIRTALTARWPGEVRVEVVLSPPWTTDWISAPAREKLASYGIAPPDGSAPVSSRIDVAGISPLRRAAPPCPRCGSRETRLVAQFGSTACKALYRCVACLEPFDYMKPI